MYIYTQNETHNISNCYLDLNTQLLLYHLGVSSENNYLQAKMFKKKNVSSQSDLDSLSTCQQRALVEQKKNISNNKMFVKTLSGIL